MARQEVKDAVKARLDARFVPVLIGGKPTQVPVIYPNTKGKAPNGVFVQVQYPVANSIPKYLRRKLEEGTIRLIIHEERGFGTDDGGRVASALTALFTDKKFGGVQTFTPSSPVEDDRSDNGAYYTLSITVPYHFYYPGGGDPYD